MTTMPVWHGKSGVLSVATVPLTSDKDIWTCITSCLGYNVLPVTLYLQRCHCSQQPVTGKYKEPPSLVRESECTVPKLKIRSDVAAAFQVGDVQSATERKEKEATLYTFRRQFNLVTYQAAQSNRLWVCSKCSHSAAAGLMRLGGTQGIHGCLSLSRQGDSGCTTLCIRKNAA